MDATNKKMFILTLFVFSYGANDINIEPDFKEQFSLSKHNKRGFSTR